MYSLITVHAAIVGCSFEKYIKDHESLPPVTTSSTITAPSANVLSLTQSQAREMSQEMKQPQTASLLITKSSVGT